MNIVLATSPAEDDKHGVRSLAPLSLGYLAASMQNNPEVTVRIVDAYGEGLSVDEAAERILAISPDLLGLSSTSFCFSSAIRLISIIKSKRKGVITVMGGYHPTMFDSLLLKEVHSLDLVIRGEGDESFPELCRRLLKSKSLAGAPGLSYRANDRIIKGIPQQIKDLNFLPFPARELFTYEGYFQQFGGFPIPEIPRTANMVTSRGCPYHCAFCPKLFPEWQYRMRSAENIFQEILELQNADYEMVFFQDENFSHDIKRLKRLCHMILEHNLRMRFVFQGTIHHLPKAVFQLMHQAGFDALFVGLDSGSDSQLRRLGKPATSNSLKEGIRRAKRAHMFVIGFFMFCGPGETTHDFEATENFIQATMPHICGGNDVSIHPQALLWNQLIGKSEQISLEDSKPRHIYTIPGQHNKGVIRQRRRSLERAFYRSWMNWRRIIDVLDLFMFNRSAQRVLKLFLKNIKSGRGIGVLSDLVKRM